MSQTLLDPAVQAPAPDAAVADPADGGAEVHVPGPPTRLSPSSAAMWAQCPQRWWFRYVDRLPEPPPGPHMVLGSFVHRILELLLDHEPAQRTRDTARALARQVWEAEVLDSPEWASLELDEAEALAFRRQAWSTVEAYFSFQRPAEVQPLARELEVEVDIEGVPFRGFIDLVEDEGTAGAPAVVVTDYKTGLPPRLGTRWSDEQVAEKLLQPLWYAAAIEALGEHVPTRARLLYFSARPDRSGQHLMRTHELSSPTGGTELAAAKAQLADRWRAMGEALAAGEAPARPGPLCGWCPYVASCAVGEAECRSRWDELDQRSGMRRLREDAPAVELLGLAAT